MDIRILARSLPSMVGLMRYAVCGVVLALIIAGAYYSGRSIGLRDARIECANKEKEVIIQEKEVVKYVEKQKDKIYSLPANTPDNLIRLFNEGKL